MNEPASAWHDLTRYTALPRLGELVLSPDGSTLLVGVAEPDPAGTGYATAWWRLDPAGRAPARRFTRSVQGESAAAFTATGDLLFASRRPVPATGADEPGEEVKALWCLPADGGEAYPVAQRSGGWTGVTAATAAPTVLLTADALVGSADEHEHASRAAERKERKLSAILHDGFPVRFWDHDLGGTDVRLLATAIDAGVEVDLPLTDVTPVRGCPAATVGGLTADGSVAVLDWSEPRRGGGRQATVLALEVATGTATTLAADPEDDFDGAIISADGRWVACVREIAGSPDRAVDLALWLIDRGTGGGRRVAADWDAWPTPRALTPDGGTLIVSVDEAGHGPLYVLDLASDGRRRLTGEGTIAAAVLSTDGRTVYAVRSSYADPGTVIAVELATGAVRELPGPVSYPPLPGRLEDVTATADDGTVVRSWLVLPDGATAAHPAPLVLWAHGGPLGSWNAWSWRWCPWLLAARGYAVLLPDPALSTGYGLAMVQRGWGRWGGEPYTDLMAATDAALRRPDLDAGRTAMMGGSFGGYLANWIAGHTDRFAAIVSHASLWNLETFGATTDAPWYWDREMSEAMRTAYSPHRHADAITTPVLVVHGDKDYRVPIAEGLALWWALVSGFDGPPEALPHRFLYFPEENHWVLTPQHAEVWYATVLSFLDRHVRGVADPGNTGGPALL